MVSKPKANTSRARAVTMQKVLVTETAVHLQKCRWRQFIPSRGHRVRLCRKLVRAQKPGDEDVGKQAPALAEQLRAKLAAGRDLGGA